MNCECCGGELVWMGSIRDGRMGCANCPKMDLAAGLGATTLTYIVPDDMWEPEHVERLRQLGWNVVKHSEFWGKPNLVIVDEFFGD